MVTNLSIKQKETCPGRIHLMYLVLAVKFFFLFSAPGADIKDMNSIPLNHWTDLGQRHDETLTQAVTLLFSIITMCKPPHGAY